MIVYIFNLLVKYFTQDKDINNVNNYKEKLFEDDNTSDDYFLFDNNTSDNDFFI